MPTQATVRRMHPDDVKPVVWVHMQAFEGFFLTFLGPSFLRELYTAVCLDASGMALVCETDADIVGFVAGTAEPQGFYQRLLRARWQGFALASIKPVAKRPTIIPRLLRAFRKPNEAARVGRRAGELMSISVAPEIQGKGIGSRLVRAFLQEARKRGLRSVRLTTDKRNNEAVNRFYQQLGFSRIRAYSTPEGREMNEYEIDL